MNTHFKIKLQIVILEKYSNPTLKNIYIYTYIYVHVQQLYPRFDSKEMLENYHWKRKKTQEPVFPTKQMHDFTQSNRVHVVSHLQITFLPFPLPLFFHISTSVRWQ